MRRRLRSLLKALGVILSLVVVLLIVGTLIGTRFNRPAKVPQDFVPPTTGFAAAGASRAGPSMKPGEIVFDSDRSGTFQIHTMQANGTEVLQLTSQRSTDAWWPRPSPDRHRILFNRTPAGTHDRDFSKVSLWVMDADGRNQRLLRPPGLNGWVQQGHAEWSPDGRSLVMFGGSRFNPQIYITDAVGQHPRNLSNRGGTNLDPSFSPDGKYVAFTGCPRSICNTKDYEVYVIPVNGGKPRRLTSDEIRDHDPYFSPDGVQIALLSQTHGGGGKDPLGVWDVRVVPAAGGTPRELMKDRNVTSRPIWAPDGKSVLVHRLEKGKDTAFQLFRISVDGKHMQRLTSGRFTNEYPG